MIVVLRTFNERVDEVDLYFNFLKYVDATPELRKDPNLFKIQKSNLILMLYNLVESSICNAIERIHLCIYENRTSFDNLRVEIKKILFKQVKKNASPHNFVSSINSIAYDIVKCGFNKRSISNGNVNNSVIAGLGREYGFNTTTDYTKTRNGSCLSDIKNKRNDLAHGTFSFADVGKDYSIPDLEMMKTETVNYMEIILQNIQSYLTNEGFKA